MTRNTRTNRYLLDDGGSLGSVVQGDPPDQAGRRRAVRRVATSAVDAEELVELLAMLGLGASEGRTS